MPVSPADGKLRGGFVADFADDSTCDLPEQMPRGAGQIEPMASLISVSSSGNNLFEPGLRR